MGTGIVLLLLVLSLTSCATQTSADPGVVTIALDQTPDNLDPRIGQNAASQRLAGLIFNSLVRRNENDMCSSTVSAVAGRLEDTTSQQRFDL